MSIFFEIRISYVTFVSIRTKFKFCWWTKPAFQRILAYLNVWLRTYYTFSQKRCFHNRITCGTIVLCSFGFWISSIICICVIICTFRFCSYLGYFAGFIGLVRREKLFIDRLNFQNFSFQDSLDHRGIDSHHFLMMKDLIIDCVELVRLFLSKLFIVLE